MTVLGTNHYWNLPQTNCKSVHIIIYLASHLCYQGSTISLAGQSALLRIDLLVDGSGVVEAVRVT